MVKQPQKMQHIKPRLDLEEKKPPYLWSYFYQSESFQEIIYDFKGTLMQLLKSLYMFMFI